MTQPAGPKPNSKKPPRQDRNLVVRDGIYYFRKVFKGKRHVISTGVRVGGAAEFHLASARARKMQLDIYEEFFGFKEKKKEEDEPEPPKTTVDEWLTKFVDTIGNRALTTQSNYRNMVTHLQAAVDHNGKGWAGRTLESITRSDCEHFLTAIRFGALKAQNSVRTLHGTASMIFQRAVDDGLIASNPWEFKRAKMQPCERVLTVEEQQAIWPHLDPYFQRIALVMLMTGMRVRELLGLTTKDVEFSQSRLHVFGKGSKWRYIPMAPEVADAIREHQAALKDGTHGRAATIKTGKLFPGTQTTLLMQWYDAADAADIPYFSNHDLRRTFGTRCAMNGVPMKVLQEWMGHSDISITAKFYVHTASNSHEFISSIRKVSVEGTSDPATKVVTLQPREAKG